MTKMIGFIGDMIHLTVVIPLLYYKFIGINTGGFSYDY